MLRIDESMFGVGRIISRVDLGHVAEFFVATSETPVVDVATAIASGRRGTPVVVDSYSLFDRRIEGDWRIVDHVPDATPPDPGSAGFAYGAGSDFHRVDLLGNESRITAAEGALLPAYTPLGDARIRRELFGVEA